MHLFLIVLIFIAIALMGTMLIKDTQNRIKAQRLIILPLGILLLLFFMEGPVLCYKAIVKPDQSLNAFAFIKLALFCLGGYLLFRAWQSGKRHKKQNA